MKKMNKMGHHQLSSAGLRHTRAGVRTKASQRVLANAVSEPEKMFVLLGGMADLSAGQPATHPHSRSRQREGPVVRQADERFTLRAS